MARRGSHGFRVWSGLGRAFCYGFKMEWLSCTGLHDRVCCTIH